MTTHTINRATRKLAAMGLSTSLSARDQADYLATYQGRRFSLPPVEWARIARRPQIVGNIWHRRTPSAITAARSLREMLERMEELGDPVAALLVAALADGRRHRRDLPGNFFAAREREGMISYTPAGRSVAYTDDGRWARSGRQETTPARWARMVLTDSTLERLGGAALSQFSIAFRCREQADRMAVAVVGGAVAICDAYAVVECGSCMIGRPVGEFYAAVGAKLAVVTQADKTIARAVLWQDGEDRYLDRIYSNSEEAAMLLRQHALEAGWRVKVSPSSQLSEWEDGEGRTYPARLSVEVDSGLLHEVGFLPYCDTLRWLNADEGTLSQHDREATHALSLTHGAAEELRVQTVDGEWIDRSDAVTDVDGDVRPSGECHYVGGEYYPEDDDRIAFCESADEYILSEDAVRVTIGRREYIVHRDCVESL
jgi:hypothetical protein